MQTQQFNFQDWIAQAPQNVREQFAKVQKAMESEESAKKRIAHAKEELGDAEAEQAHYAGQYVEEVRTLLKLLSPVSE